MLPLHVQLSERVIGLAINVHRALGPGLLENVYERALCIEFNECGLDYVQQPSLPLYYKGHLLSEHRPDLIVANRLVVEVKSVARLDPIHTAQVLTYLRVTGLRVGLLLNFNSVVMRNGVKRVSL